MSPRSISMNARNQTMMILGLVLFSLSALGCATSFSPKKVRAEVVRQTGAEPVKAFELNVGRVTMALARKVVGLGSEGPLPLAGLARFELATYGNEEGSPLVDFTKMDVRGWEPTIRTFDEGRSALILVREAGDEIGDLVLVASDGPKVLYVRLVGRLSRELPAALGEAVSQQGTDGVLEELMSLTDQ